MNLIDLLEAVYFRPYRVESSDAWVGHIPFASWLVHTLKPSVIVELGTYSGNSYLAFCQSVKENKLSTLCYAVDTWRGDEHGGFYGEEIYQALNEYHEKRYSNFSRMLRMTFDEASSYFAEKSIDLLHIDGLHTYSAVKHDFETWLPKLSPHAVVIFHDINVRERGFGVWRFWNELIKQYPLNFDFIHSNGLGVLQLSSGKGSFNVEWLRQDNKNRQIIRELFANLGQGAIDNYRLQEMGRSLKIVSSTADKYIAEINTARLVIAERDQKIKDQDQEIRDQDQRISDRDQEIRDQDQRISDRDQKIVSLQEYMVGREQILQDLNSKLLEIYSSTAWKLIQQIWKIRVFLAPRNSLRERLGKRLINVFKKTATINSHPSRSLEFNTELYRKKPLNKQHWVVMATEHTLFVAYLVTERLRTHGCKVQITTTSPADYSSDYYVVVCPQMFQSLPPAEKRISFQMEQSVSSRWFTADYLKTLHDSLAILDYSLNNIEFLDRKGIGYPQVYYLPIGASTNYGTQAPESRKKYDILFYGDGKSSPRRLKMLHALQKEFNVKVVSEVFGPELLKMIKQAKFVINIHYYENALLEIPRIQECLSLGVPVISEATQNHDDYPELAGAVRFFEQGSISNMLRTVKTALDKGISRKQVLSAAQKSDQRFAFMFDRFLMGMGFLPSSYIQNLPVPD
ncbi:MAG: class I SAM-dependent methyltransferase, partial [Anaerolineaceae bacterium]